MSRESNLPNKRMRDLEARLDAAEATVVLGMEIHEIKGVGRKMRIGGVWSSQHRMYIEPLPADWKPARVFTVGPNQYNVALDFYDAMLNEQRVSQGLKIIQDIVTHGGRRSGKSSALAPCGAMAMIMYPGSLGLILGPLKRHGDRIMAMIRRVLDPAVWTYDRREALLKLVNTSQVTARNASNYNNEVGDGLRWMVIDEAALLPEVVYEKLSPSLYDHNGVCCMSTTPRGHNWVYRKTMQARGGSEAIRDHVFPIFDNVFLSESAKRRAIEAAETLSRTGYTEEVLGEYVAEAGVAFGDFTPDGNVRDWHEMPNDATERLADIAWGEPFKFIASVDFNFNPTIGVIAKFDDFGRAWILAEVSADEGSTETWGLRLADTLRALGSDDPIRDCVIIADASGRWQGTGKNAAHEAPTWAFLRAQGWNLDSPTGSRVNPRRVERLEITRSLLCNARGDRRLFVDPECAQTIEMFRELSLKAGVPDKRNPHIHTYDGATYGIYRIWGTRAGEECFGFPLVKGIADKDEAA